MPDWFIDLENGSDGNSGDSFAVTLNGTTTVTNGTTTVTRAAGGFTGLAGRKIYFQTTAAGRTLNSITSDTAAVMNATVGAATQTANVGGARKTFTNLTTTTAQGLAAGDRVKVMGSASPSSTGITAVFTEFSPTVTLLGSSSVQVNTGESAWTGVSNVTVTQSTTAKQGTYSVSMAVAAAFTTGKAAYFDLGSTIDYSAYRILTFWMQQTSGTLMTTAGDVSIRLCSDNAGATPVSTFSVPAIRQPGVAAAQLGVWIPVAVDLGSAVSSTCRSIAIYIGVDRGAQTFLFDDFRLWSAGTSCKVISDCEVAWTASTNVTCTAPAGKVGTNCAQMAIAAAFTTGKAAYRALGSTMDLSAYTGVALWYSQTAGTIAGAGQLTLRLCSDTTGDVTVDTLTIPTLTGQPATGYVPIVIDKGSALGNSIQSIALYVATDLAAQTIRLDHIVAVNANSLDYGAVFGTGNAIGAGGTDAEPWFQFRAIDPVTCTLSPAQTGDATTGSRGWVGDSTITALWRRPTIIPYGSGTTAPMMLNFVSGTSGSPLTISGGWDRTNMSTQNLESWIVAPSSACGYVCFVQSDYVTVEKIAFIGGGTALQIQGQKNVSVVAPQVALGSANLSFTCTTECTITLSFVVYCSGNTGGISAGAGSAITIGQVASPLGSGPSLNTCSAMKVDITEISNTGGYGVFLSQFFRSDLRVGLITQCSGNGLDISGTAEYSTVRAESVTFNNVSGINVGNACHPTCRFVATTANNTASLGSLQYGFAVFEDSTFNEVMPAFAATGEGMVLSYRHGGSSTLHRMYADSALAESDTSVRKTASGYSWRVDISSATNRSTARPFALPLGWHYLPSGSSTISTWVRRTDTNLAVTLACPGYQAPGITTEVTTSMTAAINTWEQISIVVAPSVPCCVRLEVRIGGAVASAYVDDLTVAGRAISLDQACLGIPFSHPAFPAAGDVRSGTGTGDGVTTGTLTLPAVGDVRTAKTYGAAGTEYTGTLTLPAAADVRTAKSYGSDGTEFTGTITLPAVGDVRTTKTYGSGGTEFTGTLTLPAVGDVRTAKTYGSGGTEYTGTLTLPAESKVLTGNSFGSGGTEYTGTVVLPDVGDVQLSVTFGAGSGLTGTFAVPAVGNVKSGVQYGKDGTEFTGTLVSGGDEFYAAFFG